MDKIEIQGGQSLHGTITVSGAKNAALPLLAATLLTAKPVTLSRLPGLVDVTTMKSILSHCGTFCSPNQSHDTVTFSTPSILSTHLPYDLVRKMRASFVALGPLVARKGTAALSLPGGCAIGARSVDLHLRGLEAMGAKTSIEEGNVVVDAPDGLKGADIIFPKVTVTGTENLMMAATLAHGTTRLMNAALEPEVVDLGHLLQKMGADIQGLGTPQITIHGVETLHGATHQVIPDRIEAGTYMMAAALVRGDVEIQGITPDFLPTVIPTLKSMGVAIDETSAGLRVWMPQKTLRPVDVVTAPFPGFPTDLQAQLMVLMTTAEGVSSITETIFENRLIHVPELCRLGAEIDLNGQTARINGPVPLNGAPVMATDLRASVSLIMAGLIAKGTTTVHRVYHLDRGYDKIENKFASCGAIIKRIKEEASNHDISTVATAC